MLHVVDIESIARHEFRYSQSRGKLTELGRLQSERSQDEPRVRTLDAMRIEYCGKKQQYQYRIDHIRECIVKPIIEQKKNQTQCYRCSNPYNLHTRTSTQAEDFIVTVCVTGTTDTDPAKSQKCQIDAYRPPVERTQHTRLFIIAHNNIIYTLLIIHYQLFPYLLLEPYAILRACIWAA